MYCGNRPVVGLLTRDHVLPKSRGGQDRWVNVVTACRRCYQFKSNRTPQGARM
ncbi:MAG: HNH endonuclease [Cellvibrionales bacterium]